MDLFSCLSPKYPIPGKCVGSEPKNVVCRGRLDKRLTEGCHHKAAAARKCFNHQNVTTCDPELKPYMSRLKRYPDISEVQHCVDNINSKCRQRHITATKVVRMTMQSAEAVIRKIPDIHIIYYVRDPRGIYVSRNQHGQVRDLCKNMLTNHNDYLVLKRKFPEVFHLMRYEDLAMNTDQTAEEMFQFLNEPFPLIVKQYLYNETHNTAMKETSQSAYRANSTQTALAWRDKINKTSYQQAAANCYEILNELNYKL